ncbi:hypothetical protein HK099_002222 [Clydaea vesicula]|uniref:Uncharacterized protein n=1 Tax=Clydaea vesicula TaxID=447962 RepID=A0AAD5U765_9FUNG|nr:hypothetical protein HK099_002222 [Clydaea vesicula]
MELKLQQIYGGAMELQIPASFIDISRLREVPDNQEVFADINTDQSLIIELFDYNNDAVLKRQFPCFAEYYFEELAEFNEISKENITVFYKNNLNLADYPNLKLNFP